MGKLDKYKYFIKFYNLINIMLEVKNVILGDVGYFNGGVDEKVVMLGGGVVFIVYGEFI